MARIRTIKPDFFTSEDIVILTPWARLLYIALWCEADREGRFVWKPGTFKLRYFPGDNLKIEKLADELINRGLVVLYGDGLAYIPTFTEHQHLNPREAQSALPVPDTSPRVTDTSPRVTDTQGGREGVEHAPRASRLSAIGLPDEWREFCAKTRPDLNAEETFNRFRDFWIAKPGKDGLKLDWAATWRNWVRNERGSGVPTAGERKVAM